MLNDLINELKELRNLVEKRTEDEYFLYITSSELSIDVLAESKCDEDSELLKLKPKAPKRDVYYSGEKPTKGRSSLSTNEIFIIIFLCLIIFGLILLASISEHGKIVIILVIALIIFCIASLISENIKENIEFEKKYNLQLKKYNDNLNYMNGEYKTLLNFYNIKKVEYEKKRKEFKDKEIVSITSMRKEKINELESINNEINKYNNVISASYYGDLDCIIEILEKGRADSLKEAINLMISDKNAQALLDEEKRKNDILEQQIENERIHNVRMQNLERSRIENEEREFKRQRYIEDEKKKKFENAQRKYNDANRALNGMKTIKIASDSYYRQQKEEALSEMLKNK